MADNDTPSKAQGKCCGVVQEAQERSQRRRDQPQPWIVLKMTIGITLAIIAYASYVYIGRLCVPMIRKNRGLLGGRRVGIPFLIIFCILLVMMLWAYVMVVCIGPGKATDHVGKSPQPVYENPEDVPRWYDSASDIGAGPYQFAPQGGDDGRNSHAIESSTLHSDTHVKMSEKPDDNAGVTDAIPPVAAAHGHAEVNQPSALHTNATSKPSHQLPMMFTRRPPKVPLLRPEYRYCYKDEIVKPFRAHHCRACGTCILKYDHHCPWIGQCVGAHNHKYFVHFLQWAAVFCMWVFATLVAGVVQEGHNGNVDAQYIVIIALSALFTIFTVVLFITHVRLIIFNQSTVETMRAQEMKEREKTVLARTYSWWQASAKRRARSQWDREWGRIDKEGNLWWLGSYTENWVAVMGRNKWGWFLPVGHTLTDGINWLPNPRHDPEGRWRPRQDWPAALQ